MKIDIDKKILDKYADNPLIVPTYASRTKESYLVNDIQTLDDLSHYLAEVNDHEAYITESGIGFIKDVFGFEKLADMLFKENWYSEEYKQASEIHDWLKIWEKESKEYSNKE